MNIHDLLNAPAALGRPAVLDGAMGTELIRRGFRPGGPSCLDSPEAVLGVHRAYVEAGADAVITNTFSMNRIYAETHGVAGDLAAINRAGVRLARQAATGRVVLGDMSSTGQLLEPYGGYSEAQFEDAFREQAVWLAEAGVDGFIIETITDLREGRCALRACAGLGPPAVLSMALANLNDGGRTMMGDRVGDCAATAEADGAAAFGLNCGDLEPAEMARTVAAARNRTRLSIIAQPNAGRPRLVSDKTVFDLGPDGFAAGGRLCAEADAAVVGGCCGTTPDHIRALAQALRRD